MGFVCEWELFEIIGKNFLRGDTSLPAAQGELDLPLLVLSSLSPAKHHAMHLHLTVVTTQHTRYFCVCVWKF